jgi:hypothetical protein
VAASDETMTLVIIRQGEERAQPNNDIDDT